jgi:predicted DNA-binding protein
MCTLRGMRETSAYLSDALKEALAGAAARSGISSAAFIRDAIEAAGQHRGQPAG